MTADTPDPRPVSPPTAWEQRLLDGIRDEVAAAVLEGDAQDCSSAVCIADAVYEIVRVRLRDARPRPAMEAADGYLLVSEADLAAALNEADCSNLYCRHAEVTAKTWAALGAARAASQPSEDGPADEA